MRKRRTTLFTTWSILPPLHLQEKRRLTAALLHPHTCGNFQWPHFLSPPHPPTETGLSVNQKEWDWRFWWNILRWPVSVCENGGFLFLKNLHFLKITGNHYFGKFLPLQSLLPYRQASSRLLHAILDICIRFLTEIRKRTKTHRC